MIMERDVLSKLNQKEYQILGNSLRVFYDKNGKIIFVIDSTLNDIKPNVLLVLDPVEQRKWDDILYNDYGVDLEDVRPKKNNKYQKLDIEYTGLKIYDKLINDFNSGMSVDKDVKDLINFRENIASKLASERLDAAEDISNKARETIIKTKETISDLEIKIKQLRSKLSRQKKLIGKEPTKQSASKILRTESQIDAINEKLKRAKKRLLNAEKRMVNADDDAEIARNILSQIVQIRKTSKNDNVKGKEVSLPAKKNSAELVVKEEAPVPVVSNLEEDDDIENTGKTKVENMADEEVKPLFDKDPEILDEEIAFKPIDFGVSEDLKVVNQPSSGSENNNGDRVNEENIFSVDGNNLSFTPPISSKASDVVMESKNNVNDVSDDFSTPVLDTIKSVEQPSEVDFKEEQINKMGTNDVVHAGVNDNVENVSSVNKDNSQPKDISPAPINSGFRPVSPITGNVVASESSATRKPTMIYYIMLLVLIILSIFTLWLYQKNTNDVSPNLIASVPQVEVQEQKVVNDENSNTNDINHIKEESPFIQVVKETDIIAEPPVITEDVVTITEEQPEVIDIVESNVLENEGQMDIETENVENQPAIKNKEILENSVAENADFVVNDINENFDTAQVSAEATEIQEPVNNLATVIEEDKNSIIVNEEEIIANKPAYNVSQNEKMFIAAPEYETDDQYYEEDDYVEGSAAPVCPDGTFADVNGCCTGEIYTDLGEAGFNCCPIEGGDCFPPLL